MSKRGLPETTSWEDAYVAVSYVADALGLMGEEGDAQVGALAEPVDKLLAGWEQLDAERRRERRRVSRANAVVRRRRWSTASTC